MNPTDTPANQEDANPDVLEIDTCPESEDRPGSESGDEDEDDPVGDANGLDGDATNGSLKRELDPVFSTPSRRQKKNNPRSQLAFRDSQDQDHPTENPQTRPAPVDFTGASEFNVPLLTENNYFKW